MNRKAQIFILFCIVLLQVFAFQGVYSFLRWERRKAVCHFLKQNAPTVELTLSVNDFEKSKVEKHEIRWKGTMYDIVSQKNEGNYVKIIAFPDVKDSYLVNYWESKMPLKWDGKWSKWLNFVYLVPEQLAQTAATFQIKYSFKNNFHFIQIPLDALSFRIFPPPKFWYW